MIQVMCLWGVMACVQAVTPTAIVPVDNGGRRRKIGKGGGVDLRKSGGNSRMLRPASGWMWVF